MADFAPDTFIRAQQFTRTTHRDVYPFIDPSLPPLANSQSGRTIVITGASAGLGHLAYARSFAAASAKTLVLGARSVGKLEQVKKGLVVKFPKLEVVIGALDVADPKSQEAFWKMVKEKEGSADVLISNAGTDPGPFTVTDVDESVWWSNMVRSSRPPIDLMRTVVDCGLTNGRKPTFAATSSRANTSSACCHLRRSLPPLPLPPIHPQTTIPLSSTPVPASSASQQAPTVSPRTQSQS